MTEDPGDKLARLLALSAIRTAQIKANPLPIIDRLSDQNAMLSNAIIEAIMHLDGMTAYDLAMEHFPERPADMVQTVTLRNRRAKEILGEAIKKIQEG